MSPASGTTASSSLSFTFTHANKWQRLQAVDVLINRVLDANNACYFAYTPADNLIYLVNSSGGLILPGQHPGSSWTAPPANGLWTLQSASVSMSGRSLTLTGQVGVYDWACRDQGSLCSVPRYSTATGKQSRPGARRRSLPLVRRRSPYLRRMWTPRIRRVQTSPSLRRSVGLPTSMWWIL